MIMQEKSLAGLAVNSFPCTTHLCVSLGGAQTWNDGAQNGLWGPATVSQWVHAGIDDSCYSVEWHLGGEPGLLQTAGSQQRGQHPRDSTGFQEAGSHHAS